MIDKIINDMMQSNIETDMRCKHLCVAVCKNKKITPIKNNHSNPIVFKEFRASTHAEINILKTLLYQHNQYSPCVLSKKIKRNMSKITLVVIRISSDMQLMNSKPCIDCLKTIKEFNIKDIYYSTGDDLNPIQYEKVKNMISNHKCKGTKVSFSI